MGRRLLLYVLVAMLAACGSGPGDVPTSTAPAGAAPRAAPHPLAFTAQRVTGGQFVGSELVGHDVALWFWAPW